MSSALCSFNRELGKERRLMTAGTSSLKDAVPYERRRWDALIRKLLIAIASTESLAEIAR
jgi:hypothetical protein